MIVICAPGECVVMPASLTMRLRAMLPEMHRYIDPLAVPAEQDIIDLFALAHPLAQFPKRVKAVRTPAVALIGDDPGGASGQGGPDEWRCLRRIRDWARFTIIHGAAGKSEHYALAVQMARKVGRVAMIETTSANAPLWADRMTGRKLVILPSDGPHPLVNAEVML